MNKKIPKFKSIKEEAKFWDNHDVTDYLSELKPVKLKFEKEKQEVLTVRIQASIKDKMEGLAKKHGINLSTLARIWLIDKLRQSKGSSLAVS